MYENNIIIFDQVKKSFGQKVVLDDVSFSVNKNEIIALLGVNGAGKTTTIKMILGQQTPNSGTIKLFGQDPKNYLARQKVGTTPQNVEFPEAVKVREILEFVYGHYKNPHPIASMVEIFELSSFLEYRAGKLSGGQKRRLALALAFIGDPDVIFLDEPTTGLDVAARKILWEYIKSQAKKGKTIFLTTHYLEEIEQVASRVIFLRHGKIEIDGTVETIKKIASNSLVKVSFQLENNFNFDLFKSCEKYSRKNQITTIESYDPDNLIRELVKNNVEFKNLSIEKENLESAFLNLSNSRES